MKAWPFKDPPNTAVLANRSIFKDGEWIAYVSHDEDDGGWQFHTSEAGPPKEADAVVVGLNEIVELDESVMELADLPVGWYAWRNSKTSPWQCSKAPSIH